jgi:hypothetical protein
MLKKTVTRFAVEAMEHTRGLKSMCQRIAALAVTYGVRCQDIHEGGAQAYVNCMHDYFVQHPEDTEAREAFERLEECKRIILAVPERRILLDR